MKKCKCDCDRQVTEIGYWERCPLENGGHTEFAVQRCSVCGGICGFPDENLQIALDDGTPETKSKLAEVMEGQP